MLPTQQDFERSLPTKTEEKPKFEFYAEEVTVANAVWMEEQAKRVLSGQVQVTTALTIPTPAGSAIVSLTTTPTKPTTTTTSCAITATDYLLRALRAMEQQNARLTEQISRESANAVKPLLDVHLSAARKALGCCSCPAKAAHLPLVAWPSPARTRTDSSGATYAIAN